MEFRGVFENGVVHPTGPVSLPDGTPIRCRPDAIGGTDEIEAANARFRANKPLDELMKEQGVRALRDISDLAGDWPPEDDVDEFLRQVRQGRA